MRESRTIRPSCANDARRVVATLGAVFAALALAGCASTGWFGGSSTPGGEATPLPATGGSFTSRVKSLFSGSSASLAQAPGPAAQPSDDIACPPVEYRQGAATLSINAPEAGNSALGLRYQGSFAQVARECVGRGGLLTIKVGVQGRLVVGPAGGPGTVTVPLRYALVREGLEPRTIWTKLFTVPVAVSEAQPNVLFTHIQEEMTVPMPSATELDSYVIYIGFDPEGLRPEKPPPRAPPRGRARTQ
jgi:hypothetical protein